MNRSTAYVDTSNCIVRIKSCCAISELRIFRCHSRGLQKASGQYFAIMAADLQEPLELILGFLNSWNGTKQMSLLELVRPGKIPQSAGSPQNLLVDPSQIDQPETPRGGVRSLVVTSISEGASRLDESHSSLVGLYWARLSAKDKSLTRQKRREGKSSWTLIKRILSQRLSIFVFKHTHPGTLLDGPLRPYISANSQSPSSGRGFSGRVPVPGYSACFDDYLFRSLNLVCLGIVGSNLWRDRKYETTPVLWMRELSSIEKTNDLLRSS